MLWQKVLENGNYFYVDIFEKYGSVSSFAQTKKGWSPKKSEEGALEGLRFWSHYRSGNEEEKETAERLRIVSLNRALCYTENELMLKYCYTQRANYFLEFKKYRMCLNDIALAEKCGTASIGNADLHDLRVKCEALLEIDGSETTSPIEIPKLSKPSATIPCFAEGLQVKHSKKLGKHVVTDRNLQIGETVIVEKAFYMSAHVCFPVCANCFQIDVNLTPCDNCSLVMFCSDDCRESGRESFHNFECGLNYYLREIPRSVVKAIKLFPKVKDMMNAVENFNDGCSNTEIKPSIRTYKQFYQLGYNFEKVPIAKREIFMEAAKIIHSNISSAPAYKSSFQSVETSRFLAHLILHHTYVMDAKFFVASTFSEPCQNAYGIVKTDTWKSYAHGIYLNSSYLKHSCEPNIARIFCGDKLIGRVIRPIKRGGQLFMSYLMEPPDLLQPTEVREDMLELRNQFNCQCKRCTSIAPSATQAVSCVDVRMCQMLKNHLPVDVKELLKFEKSAVKFLEANAHLKVNDQILAVQYLLTQIWTILYRE